MYILEEIKEIKSEKRDLRNFSFVIAAALAIIGFVFFKEVLSFFILIASLLAVIGILMPRIVLWPQKFWMALGIILGFFVSKVILLILFYGVVTPLGVIARLLGKRFLQDTTNPDSYWRDREDTVISADRYEQQF